MSLTKLLTCLSVLLACLALPIGTARAASSPWVGDDHAAVRLISASEATGSAGRVDLGLEFRLGTGWHIYWRSPGDAGYPPSVDWVGSDNLAEARLSWPAPRRLTLLGFETMAYEGATVLPVTVSVARPGAPLTLAASVEYLACAEICVPYEAKLSLALPAGVAGPGPQAPLIATSAAKVPGSADAAGLARIAASVTGSAQAGTLTVSLAATPPLSHPDLFVEGLGDGASAAAPHLVSATPGQQSLTVPIAGIAPETLLGKTLDVTLTDGARSAEFIIVPAAAAMVAAPTPRDDGFAILAIALLGGLILNVMPCVLPVLSLKLLSVTAHAHGARRAVRLGFLASAAGILASFLLLALAAIGSRAAGIAVGWGMQFQFPSFLAAMILLLTAFAASLLGGWVVLLPGGVARVGEIQAKGSLANSFLTGAFATLLATPCSAPFVGTALGFALTGSVLDILLVFLAMGLGFALPYLLVAALPDLARLLPKPGRWMVWLERVMGLLLAGTALWLATVLAAESDPLSALASVVVSLAVVALLAWRQRQGSEPRRRLAGAGALALVLLAVLVPALLAGGGPSPAEAASARWVPFDPAERDRLVAEGKRVLVDVTADWCLTCKVNKAAVLDRGPVQARLTEGDIVAMRGDWTRPDPAISAYLASFQRFGIPFDAVYGPGAPSGIALPEILTDASVLGAIDRAAAAR